MSLWKTADERKIVEDVLDSRTILVLSGFVEKGVIDKIGGVIQSGKESQILTAYDKEGKKLILKVYMIETSNFQRMQRYLKGDNRFRKVGKKKKDIVFAWCRKEFKNLLKAKKAGLDVPMPIAFRDNVLVLEFLGAVYIAPQLYKSELKNPEKTFSSIVESMKKLHKTAKLVHADLSQYNIVVFKGKPYFLDFGQAVLLDHPLANEFLERDIKNICNYFRKLGVECDEKTVLKSISL